MNVDGNTPILSETEMRALGFTDHVPDHWYTSFSLAYSTSFNVTIDKATGNYEELVMDENFGQPEYYMNAIPEFRDDIVHKVDEIVSRLNAAGLTIKVDHSQYGS